MATSHRPVTAAELRRLHAIRREYARADTTAKLALLRAIAHRGVRVRTFRALDALHDDLLFLCAFPDSAGVHTAARRALGRIEPALHELSARQRALANDSGMAGSVSTYAPAAEIAEWITARFPRAIDFDWDALADTSPVDAMIRPFLQLAEDDGFESGDFSTREWMDAMRDPRRESALAWLMRSAKVAPSAAYAAFRAQYDFHELPLRWRLAHSPASVTHNRLQTTTIVSRAGMRRVSGDPILGIAEPLSGIVLLAAAEAATVIEVARATLAARCREVYAFSHANPHEVWWCPLGEGVSLAVLGVLPARRFSLESNYGYVLFSNGIPIGYGGVTPLWHQANTGINIFAPFRGSEAAFLWQQSLRAFHTLFGVTRFVVDAVQFGAENDEAIGSGAYWFYWRLGFRPHAKEQRGFAHREATRLARSRTKRSSAATLRALAHGTLELLLPGGESKPYFPEKWLPRCAHDAALLLERTHSHDHRAAGAQIAQQVARSLGLPRVEPFAGFGDDEREAFLRLAPLVQLSGGSSQLGACERRAMVELIRAKGGTTERPFVAASVAHPRLMAGLRAYAEKWRAR